MVLSIYLTITILYLHFAYHVKKTLNFLENSLIFMVSAIITRQCLTLFALEWGLYKMTEDDWLFVALILCRDILTPMTAVIFINFYIRAETTISRLAIFLLALGVLLGLHKLAVHFHLLTYLRWNFFYTALLNTAILLVAIGVFKIIQLMENRQNENVR